MQDYELAWMIRYIVLGLAECCSLLVILTVVVGRLYKYTSCLIIFLMQIAYAIVNINALLYTDRFTVNRSPLINSENVFTKEQPWNALCQIQAYIIHTSWMVYLNLCRLLSFCLSYSSLLSIGYSQISSFDELNLKSNCYGPVYWYPWLFKLLLFYIWIQATVMVPMASMFQLRLKTRGNRCTSSVDGAHLWYILDNRDFPEDKSSSLLTGSTICFRFSVVWSMKYTLCGEYAVSRRYSRRKVLKYQNNSNTSLNCIRYPSIYL
jgi:hypothetical protein